MFNLLLQMVRNEEHFPLRINDKKCSSYMLKMEINRFSHGSHKHYVPQIIFLAKDGKLYDFNILLRQGV